MRYKLNELDSLVASQGVRYVTLGFIDFEGKLKQIDTCLPYILEKIQKNLGSDNLFITENVELKCFNEFIFLDPFRTEPTLFIFCENTSDKLNTKKILNDTINHLENEIEILLGFSIEFSIFDIPELNTCLCSVEAKTNREAALLSQLETKHYAKKYRALIMNETDTLADIRTEIVRVLQDLGINVHFHNRGLYFGQNSLTFKPVTIMDFVSYFPIIRYVIRNVVASYGKSVTFIPCPIKESYNNTKLDIYLKNASKNIRDKYLSALKSHLNSLIAFTNPSTNSYKKLSQLNISNFECNFVQEKLNNIISLNYLDGLIHPDLLISFLLLSMIDNNPLQQEFYLKDFSYTLDKLEVNSKHLPAAFKPILKEYVALKLRDCDFLNSYNPKEIELYYNK